MMGYWWSVLPQPQIYKILWKLCQPIQLCEALPWASKAGGGGRGDASPAVEKSAEDVPPEIMIFQYLFS